MFQFLASLAAERNDMRPVSRNGAKAFANRIVADIAELLNIVRIVAQAGIPEIALKTNAKTP